VAAAKANLPQNKHVQNTNVCFDSVAVTFHSKTRSEENKKENNGEPHGKEREAPTRLDSNSTLAGNIHHEPDKEGVSHILCNNTSRYIIFGECSGSNNLVHKVINSNCTVEFGIAPRSVGTERDKEGIDDPCDKDSIVGEKHESTCYTTQPNTTQAGAESSKNTNISILEELSETNLEDGKGDSNKDQGQEVRDKESASSAGYAETQETPDITW